jgi:hypothetical protein
MLGDADLAVRNSNDVMGRDGAPLSSGGGEGEGVTSSQEGISSHGDGGGEDRRGDEGRAASDGRFQGCEGRGGCSPAAAMTVE